jgi:uncharacterized protein YbjT (DUF2867 family)
MKDLVVVTGASGQVGRQLARRLLADGRRVRVVGRNARALQPLADLGAQIRVGSFQDPAVLKDAFQTAAMVFVLTPADTSLPDLNAEQERNIHAIAAAVRDSGVPKVVALSSWGAEMPDRIGGIIACRWLEHALDEVPGLDVVHLRPVWFMENFLWNIGLMKSAGINGLAIEPDLAFPMIAASDIATVAGDYLTDPTFNGRTVQYLNGPREYSMTDVTRTLGASIGKPDLRYIRFPDAIMRKGLISNGGLSPNAADLLIETSHGINTRQVTAEPRSPHNTTPTTLEEFAEKVFAPKYLAAPEPSLRERLGGTFLRSYLSLPGRR